VRPAWAQSNGRCMRGRLSFLTGEILRGSPTRGTDASSILKSNAPVAARARGKKNPAGTGSRRMYLYFGKEIRGFKKSKTLLVVVFKHAGKRD